MGPGEYLAWVSVPPSDRAAILAEVRAHLEWELACAGVGIPVVRIAREQARDPSHDSGRPVAEALRPIELPASEARTQLAVEGQAALGPRMTPEERRVRLGQLENEVRGCVRCDLAKARTQTVFARGNPDSPLVFIGEGPGQEEDRTGTPFVGPAGQLLDKMVAAMGFGRDDVYICNVVKCRPPGNRTPLPSEAGACSSYLLGQVDAIAPKVLVALGRCAAENMGLVGAGGGWRGRWGSFRGIPVMPTYHPAFLLRSPEFKRPVWEDLQKVMARLKA
jgi:uracil-DNA glycosylase